MFDGIRKAQMCESLSLELSLESLMLMGVLCELGQRAPVDEVMAWGESINHLLECKTGQLVFEDFLRTEYSEENLLFWLACEDYKKITRETEMTSAAKRIYTEFVEVDAPRQINIDCVTREEISENLSQPEPNCFDRAQRLIYGLMENDCYPRFLKSEMYQALLEQAEQQ
ncbi:regulator of G-protein signaling 21-like [Centropristis striata]|uniref:regulator of G-protein signaling 21-like n=1 Tax=Centropristis striata TaxID=184440 RepID=UPI0027DEDFCA|nr:regulator of G-protein signaling 21-like [Centropristis striata]